MELLLNLIWIALAMAALLAFTSRRVSSSRSRQGPYVKALFALACGLVLLFPIISASDDLHPVQAVLEDASRRVQRVVSPVSLAPDGISAAILPALVATNLFFALVTLQRRHPRTLGVRLVDRERTPIGGRAPPSIL